MDITSKYKGKIVKLYYQARDIAHVGKPLVDIRIADSGSPSFISETSIVITLLSVDLPVQLPEKPASALKDHPSIESAASDNTTSVKVRENL